MLKRIRLFALLFLLFSCSDKKETTVPDSVLSKEKMAAVMVDIQLVEASLNMTGVKARAVTIPNSSALYITDVFKKNNISKKQFDNSYLFYTANPELLSEVYQLVLNDLSKMQAEAMKKK